MKDAIARRIAAIGSITRYVYMGTQPLQDFRVVAVDKESGITEEAAKMAIQILK